MWRILFNRMIISILLYQIVMIGILKLKSANGPAFSCVPLPILTALFKIYCFRRLDPHAYYYKPDFVDDMPWFGKHPLPSLATSASHKSFTSSMFSNDSKTATHNDSSLQPSSSLRTLGQQQQTIGQRFGDPAFFSELPIPMVHENVRHLLPGLYGTQSETRQKTITSKLTRQKSVRHLSMIQLPGHGMPFQSIKEDELENDDSTEGLKGFYKFDDDDDAGYSGEQDPHENNHGNPSTATPSTAAPELESVPLYAPLSTLPQSQIASNRSSTRFGSLLRDTSASLLMTGRSSHADPYSVTRPLMMNDDHSAYGNQPFIAGMPNESTTTIQSTTSTSLPSHQANHFYTETYAETRPTQSHADVIELSPFDQDQSSHWQQRRHDSH